MREALRVEYKAPKGRLNTRSGISRSAPATAIVLVIIALFFRFDSHNTSHVHIHFTIDEHQDVKSPPILT